MESSAFDRLWDFLTSTELFLGVLWAGLAALSVTLLVLMWTRWGQSRPLRKCLFLSLVAHALLFGYSTTVQVFTPAESPGEPAIRVSLAEEDPEREASSIEASPDAEKPWETLLHDSVAQPDLDEPSKVETPELPEPPRKPAPTKPEPPEPVDLDHLPLADAAEPEARLPTVGAPSLPTASGQSAEPIEAPAAQARDADPVLAPAPPLPAQAAAPSQPSLPEREEAPGLPSALLERPDPLPKMEQAARTVDAADSMADLADVPLSTPRGTPAEPIDPQAGGADAPDGAPPERLRPPSLASLGDKNHAGGEAASVSPGPMIDVGPPQVSLRRPEASSRDVPEIYRLRVAADRDTRARKHGATAQSEEAVQAGLKWLADHQEPDGRWCPAHYEGNQETLVAGEDRRGTTMQADTGMTGLALLAFLA
ncbi:MAG: hypothetical protein NTW96_14985, partial [Planctomycetia bacterium]|nr:hypothetical protein [Planctomycetia bacterium]